MKTRMFLVIVTICLCQRVLSQQTHIVALTISQPPLLVASAGADIDNASELDVVIGGMPAATGGTQPYNYAWLPVKNLSDPAVANPTLDLIASAETYTLTVTDARGCTSEDVLNILVSIVSVEEGAGEIIVYPNPASRQLTVEVNTTPDLISLYDDSGKRVFEEQPSSLKYTLDLIPFPKGLYHLKVTQAGKIHVIKLLIN